MAHNPLSGQITACPCAVTPFAHLVFIFRRFPFSPAAFKRTRTTLPVHPFVCTGQTYFRPAIPLLEFAPKAASLFARRTARNAHSKTRIICKTNVNSCIHGFCYAWRAMFPSRRRFIFRASTAPALRSLFHPLKLNNPNPRIRVPTVTALGVDAVP